MSGSVANNLKRTVPMVNESNVEGRYNTEDISPLEKEYIKRHTPKPRKQRQDLACGNVVVILEGPYMSRRAVLLAQLPDNMAAVFCFTSAGAPAIFSIDERYLFKLSVCLELSVAEGLSGTALDCDATELSGAKKAAAEAVMAAIGKVKFMKSYLLENFEVDHSVEFYSQDY